MTDTQSFLMTPMGVSGPGETSPEEPSGSGRRTLLVALVAGAGLLVAGLAAYFFVFSGSDSATTTDSAVPKHVTGPATLPKPAAKAPAKAATATLPKASTANLGHDPFAPLLVAAPANLTGAAAAGATAPAAAPAAATGTGTSTTVLTLKVLTVSADNSKAGVTVNGKAYTPAVGGTFATYFQVVRLTNGKCGTFKFGDGGTFDLCEGQSAKMK